MRINLANDPSLRSGTTNAYLALPGTALSLTDEWSFYGQYALLVSKDAVNGAGVEIAVPIPVMAGKPYAFSIYARLPTEIPHAESAEIIMQIEWMNSLGTVIGTSTSATLDMDSDASDYRIGGVWTAPTGATFASVSIIQPLPGTQGATFMLDALLVEQSTYIGGYFDNLPTAKKNQIVNKALSAVPQVINGLRLGADVVLNGLVLNTIDEDDTIWVVTDIDGWWGQADPELPDIPRGTEDGSYDVEGRTKARQLSISGFFIPKDAEQSLSKSIDRLILATSLTRKGGWLHAHEDPTKAAWVRLSSKPTIKTVNARGRTNFNIDLRAGDPIKYHWNDADPDGFSGADYRSSDIIDQQFTNMATHGTFEVPGSAVEVRRNLFPDPYMTSTNFVTTASGQSTATIVSGAVRWTLDTDSAIGINLNRDLTTGVAHRMLVRIRANKSLVLTPRINGTNVTSGTVTVGTAWTWVDVRGLAGGTITNNGFLLGGATGHAVGDWIEISRALLAVETDAGEHFGGNITIDSDMTAAWIGTANASDSVLMGVSTAVYGTSISVARGLISTQWKKSGSSSLRIIPTYIARGSAFTNIASFGASANQGMEYGKTYTVIGWFRQAAPQTFPDNALARSITMTKKATADAGYTNIVTKAANVAGEQIVRHTFTLPPDGEWYLRLYNGGQYGDPDIFWDDITIVEGDYYGPPFSGDTPSSLGDVYSWSGAANASQSFRTIYNEDILTNIGTAEVTGTFTITGPAGAGTRVFNATTGQTMELAQPLRGAGLIADAYQVSSTDGIATILTTKPNHLRVGDEVGLLNMVIPFSESDQTRIVTAVSDVFPFSFSVAIPTDDIDPMSTSGQIRLVKNDVLVIDTYNRAVTYNGEAAGHRNKLTTLTDWIKFAPGDNIIEYFDDVTEVEVVSKMLSGNTVTLETDDTHYLVPGEQIKVALPETVPLSKKSLTGNVVKLTTSVPHGYAVGDTVDVQSTETAKVITKSRTSNVATLTTETPHGVAQSDTIVVALPASASPNQKSLTSNVASLGFQHPHGFTTGDTVVVALPTQAAISNKQLTNNQATLTTTGAHTFAVGDTITVAMPAGASVTDKARNGSQVTLTTATAHGFSVGDQVIVALPETRNASGNFVADGVSNLVTVTTTAAHGFSVGDKIDVAHIVLDATRTVTNRVATTTTVTLTVGANSFVVGERITVAGVGTRYNGSFFITARTTTTVSYASAGAAEASVASSGTVTDQSAIATFNGSKVVETTPTGTTFTYRDWDQNVNVTRPVGTTVITNLTNQSYNGTKAVISASGTTFAYNL